MISITAAGLDIINCVIFSVENGVSSVWLPFVMFAVPVALYGLLLFYAINLRVYSLGNV